MKGKLGAKRKKVFCRIAVIASVLALMLVPVTSKAKPSTSELEKSIKEKQAKIDSAKDEKKQISNNITNMEKVKKDLEKAKSNLATYVNQLDQNVTEIQGNIDILNQNIEYKEQEISVTKEELAEAEAVRDEHYESMKSRVKSIYEQPETCYLEMLVSSESMVDFINRLDYIEMLADYDKNMFDDYKEIVEYVTLCKEELEEEEAALEESKRAAEAEERALNELIAQKEIEIQAYENDIKNKDQVIKEYEADLAEQNAIISELEKAIAEDRKNLWNQRVYDGGAFCWPAPSYTRVSDDYGYRIHPILKVQQFHNGVDLASPSGSDILAAYDGTVVSATYNASMGNYIMINHGDGLITIYMHASKLLVSEGDEVSRGQKIALVGSTGRSTGPHLHFSVRSDGSYVSPWNYITKP